MSGNTPAGGGGGGGGEKLGLPPIGRPDGGAGGERIWLTRLDRLEFPGELKNKKE